MKSHGDKPTEQALSDERGIFEGANVVANAPAVGGTITISFYDGADNTGVLLLSILLKVGAADVETYTIPLPAGVPFNTGLFMEIVVTSDVAVTTLVPYFYNISNKDWNQ